MRDADKQLRQLAKHQDSTVRARTSVLGELFAALESQNQALQAVLRLVDEWMELGEHGPAGDAFVRAAVRDALSPTQETDPAWDEDIDDGPPLKLGKPVHDWEDDPAHPGD